MTECPGDPVIEFVLSWGEAEGESLTLPPDCPEGGGLWWNKATWPAFAVRYENAPPSGFVGGDMLLGYVPDAADLPLTVAARGTDVTTLLEHKAVLRAAVYRYPYTVGIYADGVLLDAWQAKPTLPVWGPITPQRMGTYAAEAVLSIPLNPAGSP